MQNWFGTIQLTTCTVKQFMHALNKFGVCPHNDGCYKTLRATYHRKGCPLYRDKYASEGSDIKRANPKADERKFDFTGDNINVND